MKIFISWSGNRSRAVAEALNDWLQRVIQAVEPFYTPHMEKGVKWSNEIDDALEGTRFGIVCLTPDNLNNTWIHYEAGALSKTKDAVIWTFLHGLTAGDVPPPLGKFQHTLAEKTDILKLLHSINARLREVGTGAIKDALLEEIFEETWSKLETRLNEAEKLSDIEDKTSQSEAEYERPDREILEEILEIVREQFRENSLPLSFFDSNESDEDTFSNNETFLPGTHVRHPKYGKGLVLRREGKGDNVKLIVSFPGFGQKKLIEKVTRLTKT